MYCKTKPLKEYLKHLIDCCYYFLTRWPDLETFSSSLCDDNALVMHYGGFLGAKFIQLDVRVELNKGHVVFSTTKTECDENKHENSEHYTEAVPLSIVKHDLQNNDHTLSKEGNFFDEQGLNVLQTYFKEMLTKLHHKRFFAI